MNTELNPAGSCSEERILDHPRSLYENAVLHILVAGARKSWRLLFAFVELLPLEVPSPLHDGFIEGPHLRKSGWRIFGDHVPLSATQALAWYEDARGDRVVRPESNGSLLRGDDFAAKICEPLSWTGEPHWPRYVVATSQHRLPFLSRWHATPRMHHLIPSSSTWDFSPEDSATIDDFMEQELGFRRSTWPQLAETIHLVVPNPFYRAFDERLVAVTPPATEAVAVRVEPRAHVALPELQLEMSERRPTGCTVTVKARVSAQPSMIELGPELHETCASVALASGGLLETRPPASFNRSLGLTLDGSNAVRTVNVTDPQGRLLESYKVSVSSPLAVNVGAMPPRRAVDTLNALMNEVSVRDAAHQLEQRWFAGDPEGARDFVRALIGKAREQVLIADPYLGGVEVQRFALAVLRANVPLRLLTTREGFKNAFTPRVLEVNIARWQKTEPSLGAVSLRVMPRDELHDRFLRVDGRLYTLGNSLNALGEKGSLVMRIPDPAPVFDELDRIWNSAQTLAELVADWREPEPGSESTT